MDLSKRFQEIAGCRFLKIAQLEPNRDYAIVRVVRVPSCRNGKSVYLIIHEVHKTQLYKVYLPVHYGEIFTDSDITSINDDKLWLNLIFKGHNEYGFPDLAVM
jgi:hypothetical protein